MNIRRPLCAVRDMFHTCSRRFGSTNRNCAGIDFPVRREGALHQRVQVPPEELSMHLGSYRARSRCQSDRGSRSPETEGL